MRKEEEVGREKEGKKGEKITYNICVMCVVRNIKYKQKYEIYL